MRTLIRQKRRTGREVTEWLSVIDEFDQLVADRAPLERLVDAAVGLTGRRGVRPRRPQRATLRRRRPALAADDRRAARRRRPRDHDADGDPAPRPRDRDRRRRRMPRSSPRASTTPAGGSALCWLDQGAEPWRPLDELVVQRLSSAAAINSVRLRDERATRSRLDYAALEQLLSTPDDRRGRRRGGPTGGPPAGTRRSWPWPRGRSPAATSGPEALAQTLVAEPRAGRPQLPLERHRPVRGDRRRGRRDDR